jgi:hypothetical protein
MATASVDAEKLVTESVIWLNTKTLDLPTAIQLGGWLAAKVNAVKGLKGLQKQELVCRVVEDVVKRASPEGDAARDALLTAVKVALPAALSVAVDAANGRLSLKKVSPSCLARGFLCFARAAVDVAEAAKVVDAATAKKIEGGLDKMEATAAVLVPPASDEQKPANPESQTPETSEKAEGEPAAKPTDGESQKEEVRVEFP